SVDPDGSGGYLVRVETERFQFTSDMGDHQAGVGHAHLYVDGKKAARLYSPVTHLPELDRGRRTVTVVLATRDHRLYAHAGEAIRAERVVDVP
ncbi:MAG: hypothetical protein AAF752_11755, partial [Bacteroidota bacterium]